MDDGNRRAEFARNIEESRKILNSMRAQARADNISISTSQTLINESWDLLRTLPQAPFWILS